MIGGRLIKRLWNKLRCALGVPKWGRWRNAYFLAHNGRHTHTVVYKYRRSQTPGCPRAQVRKVGDL